MPTPNLPSQTRAFVLLFALIAALAALSAVGIKRPTTAGAFISPADGLKALYVPAGKFQMGSKFGMSDEQPLHPVYLDAFWIDQTEITNAAYRRCVEAGVCARPASALYYGNAQYANHPVEFVSWNDARDYCAWVGRRLPTEAEWEKAARWDPQINVQRIYPWGNEFDCRKGNFDDETELDASIMPDTPPDCDGFPRSSPVGSFPAGASPYGALDMGGNVWEWTHDAFLETDPFTDAQNYYAVSPLANPQGVDPALSDYRVLRGGSWNWTFGVGRAAYRLWYGLYDRHDGAGFRCAQSQP